MRINCQRSDILLQIILRSIFPKMNFFGMQIHSHERQLLWMNWISTPRQMTNFTISFAALTTVAPDFEFHAALTVRKSHVAPFKLSHFSLSFMTFVFQLLIHGVLTRDSNAVMNNQHVPGKSSCRLCPGFLTCFPPTLKLYFYFQIFMKIIRNLFLGFLTLRVQLSMSQFVVPKSNFYFASKFVFHIKSKFIRFQIPNNTIFLGFPRQFASKF